MKKNSGKKEAAPDRTPSFFKTITKKTEADHGAVTDFNQARRPIELKFWTYYSLDMVKNVWVWFLILFSFFLILGRKAYYD